MATLTAYFSTSTNHSMANTYKLVIGLGTIENLSPPLEINLLVVPIPTLGSRSNMVMDINGMTEKYDVEGFVINGACNTILYRWSSVSTNHWEPASVGKNQILYNMGWGSVIFNGTKTDSATFIKAVRNISVAQMMNLSPASTETNCPTVLGGGLFFSTTAADVNTDAFPQDTMSRVYISDFNPKYANGVPNAITYSMTLTMAGSLGDS